MGKLAGRGRYATETYPESPGIGSAVPSPPTGPAGGDLDDFYPDPTVVAIEETSTPARLAIGGIPDGELLRRSGLTVVGAGPFSGPIIAVHRLNDSNLGGTKLVDVVTTDLRDGTIAEVYSVGSLFQLVKSPSATLLAAVDGIQVVASTATVGSVWVRMEVPANQRFGVEPPLFIDPASGSDDNDGLLIGTALKSVDEWSRRMNGVTVTADLIVVQCAAGNIGNLFGKIFCNNGNLSTGCIIRFVGSKTLSSAMTVSSFTAENSAPGSRQEYFFVKTGGPVLTGNERMRVLTSGTPSRVGAVGYAAGFEGSNVDHPYSSAWSSEAAGFASVFPGVGDTIAVETLTTELRAFDIDWHGIGKSGSHIELEDLFVNESSGLPGFTSQSNVAKVTVFGDHIIKRCQFIGASIFRLDGTRYWFRGCEFQCQVFMTGENPGYSFYQSVFRAQVTIGSAGITQVGCAFEALAQIDNFWSNGSDVLFRRIMSGVGLVVGSRGLFATNTGRTWSPPPGARNGTTYLTQVNPFGQMNSNTFAAISESAGGSLGAIIMNSRPVQTFTIDINGCCSINCTDSATGALVYYRDVTGNPATPPVGGCYTYSVAGQLRVMNPAGVVTPLN